MKLLKHNRYKDLDPSNRREIREKLLGAEKNIALLRFILVLFNFAIYIFLIDRKESIEPPVYGVVIFAFFYSLSALVFRSHKQSKIFLLSYITSGIDVLLIAMWVVVTGSFESPFYLLFYVSILGIAMRYTMTLTIYFAISYAVLYFFIMAADVNLSDHLAQIVMRIGYLLFIAVIGALMSQEIIDQILAKILIEKSGDEIKKREHQLKEAHDKLEERVKERTIELANSNQQLLRINEDIDNFVYAVSHDLKTPVLNVEALINLLCEEHELKSDFEKDLRQKVDKSLERMKRTINSLAEVAKAQKGVYEDIEKVNFSEILHEVIGENEEVIKRENATIQYDFHDAGEMVCSKTCIKSIIYNLLTNAIKYKYPKRDPVIEFRSGFSGGELIFSVKDNGLGIDVKKNKEKLFKIFKRFHDHVEGEGIGLYTIKRMVEKYNGEIYVESEPGMGSTFYIKFRVNSPINYLAVT